jgi:uncharacterized repeat protein (TIGR04052 family)
MKTFNRLCAALWLACASWQASVHANETQTVEIRFTAEINGQSFACGRQYGPVGASASTIQPTDYRMFVSEAQLIARDGRRVPIHLTEDQLFQFENIALLDFEDGFGPCRNGTPAVNTSIRGHVPKGDYLGLSFVIGVPFARNHGDPTLAPAPLSSTAMFWTWQGGYKFIRFDTGLTGSDAEPAAGHAPGAGHAATGFSIHLGSTRCASAARTQAPSACLDGNRMAIQFDQFDVARHQVVVDVGAVLAESDLTRNTPKTSPGCMSFPGDPECIPVMRRLGLAYDGAPPGEQRLITRR